MLARYRISRGKRPPDDPLPLGIRQDTRKHTKHCLRPTKEMVEALLVNPDENWAAFEKAYQKLLAERFAEDPAPFDEIYESAREENVYLGCSCPTQKNPNVQHCHTVLALHFMKQRYRKLVVHFPS